MKGIMKGLTGIFAIAICLAAGAVNTNAGTGIYVGKDVSTDGTTFIGVSVEQELGMSVVPVELAKGIMHKGDAIECQNGFVYTLPEDSAAMVLEHLMTYVGMGQWNCLASNEYGVSVIATLTTDSNTDAVIADPFVSDGISEEKIAQILAATSKNAKDAVRLLCSIYEEKGAAAAEIVFIADREGVWAVENFTGHQYVATKLPDDKIATFSNEPIIRTADPDDPDTICSSGLFSLPEDNGFVIYDKDKNVDLILSYLDGNQYSDEWHLRGWVGHDIFAPSEELDYDDEGGYDVFFAPDEKVSIEQAFSFFRNRFEGTAYDLADADNTEEYWGINNQAVACASVVQIFDDVPAPISSVIWTTPGNPTASPFIPIPAFADALPEEISTDIDDEEFKDGIAQFDFAKLNSTVYPRRNVYGDSIRQYWEGTESVCAEDIADSVRGKWKDAYEASPAKAVGDINDYVENRTRSVQEDCTRLTSELEWHLFRTGVRKSEVPDDMMQPFECSFDAVSYAHANGWETVIENDVFTATKDGRTIEITFDGDDKGNIVFTGFDNDKLTEDFYPDKEVDENGKSEEEPAAEEVKEDQEEAEAEEADTGKEAEDSAADDGKSKEEAASETEEPAAEPEYDEEKTEELAESVSEQIEVDTIAELQDYFNEKINAVPRDGWAENEIGKQLADVSGGVTEILGRHFSGDIEELLNLDDKKFAEIAEDADVPAIADKMIATGMDLSALTEKYFSSLYEDVSEDIVNGRLTQDGAVRILNEAAVDIEGIATIYLEGLAGAFGEVFNTDLTPEELAETLAELGEGTLQIMEDYGAIDRSQLGLEDVDLTELTDADIDVVITLSKMDDDVIEGLSSLLGVDVRKTLDEYIDQIDKAAGDKVTVIREDHEAEKAQSAPDEEVMAAIELQEALSDEDIVIPQEVIDILNEAIAEAAAERGEDAKEAVIDDVPAAEDKSASAGDDTKAPSEEEDPDKAEEASGTFAINIKNVQSVNGKVMLPAYMLKYFN